MRKVNWKTTYLGSRPWSYGSLFKDTMIVWTSSIVLFYGSQLNIAF